MIPRPAENNDASSMPHKTPARPCKMMAGRRRRYRALVTLLAGCDEGNSPADRRILRFPAAARDSRARVANFSAGDWPRSNVILPCQLL